MANTLACGVAGVGYLGQHHARIYTELRGVKLAGVYDPDARRAREVADRHGCGVFKTLEEMGSACEAVSVVAPTDRHMEVSLPLLERGCHVLIEKPLCQNLEEADCIQQAAKAANCLVQVGHIEHFNPVMKYLEKTVSNPRFITCDRLGEFKKRGTEVGVVLDLMIHDIGIILQLVRSPLKRVDAVGVKVLTGSEDIANARLLFENGCVANINASRVSLKPVREIRVFQENTYLSLNFAGQSGHLVRKTRFGLRKKDIPIEKGEPLMLELASFVESVRKRMNPKVDAELGTTALSVALRISEAIRDGQ